MPRFRAGTTNLFLYHPSKRRPRTARCDTKKKDKGGSWVAGSYALIVVVPASDRGIQQPIISKEGLKFGGREHTISELDGRFVVVQHGSDAIGG